MRKKFLTLVLFSLLATMFIFCFTACNTDDSSKGLEYKFNEESQSYILIGRGKTTDKDLKITSEYNGLPVTEINDFAFYNCSDITSVVIPDSITSLGKSAFNGCTGLVNIQFGKGLKQISNAAFYGCLQIEKITIPDNIVSIAGNAFANCVNLSFISLPKGINAIGNSTFENCLNLKKVYYAGNEQEKESLTVREGNSELLNARWYFFSSAEPSTNGDFWHYLNGQIEEW